MYNLLQYTKPPRDFGTFWQQLRYSILAAPAPSLPPEVHNEATRQRRYLLHTILKIMLLGGLPLHAALIVHMWREVYIVHRWPPLAYTNYIVYLVVLLSVGGVLYWRKQFESLAILFVVATTVECALQVLITGYIVHFGFVIPIIALLALVLSVPVMLLILATHSLFLFAAAPALAASSSTQVGIAIITIWVFVSFFTSIGIGIRNRIDDLAKTMYGHQLAAVEQAQLRAAAKQAQLLATEHERMRIAGGLHDNVQHTLSATAMQLEACDRWLERDLGRARQALGHARSLTDEGMIELRRTVYALHEQARPEPLSRILQVMVEQFSTDTLRAFLYVQGIEQNLSVRSTLDLHAVAQESLTNAQRHARASEVYIWLDFTHADHLRLRIRDNGRGAEHVQAGFGMTNMRGRIEALGGTLQYRTAVDQGFEVNAEVPYESHARTAG